ncbi:MAG: hydroxymethylglutaryl-CoA reductase, degradative [Chloroflexi bacterium OLB13]|nr:MAG: hydroxymethylglutaryl-CoA reductase, degradative [Chloroflexi bacterium OLB13]
MTKTSQISQFYKLSIEERRAIVSAFIGEPLPFDSALPLQIADHMIENVVGVYGLPFGIATNFVVNGVERLVPMVVEEPSVVAAASFAAKLFRAGGGFSAQADNPLMIGQIQVLDIPDLNAACDSVLSNKALLLAAANRSAGSLVRRGGGARDIEVRSFVDSPAGPMLVVHLLLDTVDAMGANAINTALEAIAPDVERMTGGRVVLRILSNLSDRRRVQVSGRIPAAALGDSEESGRSVARGVVEAWAFAHVDPYRAATHNKGLMNGVDAVVIATGNDWRAVEAGAHAFAARSGSYTSLSRFWLDERGDLVAELDMPLAVGIVGGATKVHPLAQVALRILGVESARDLAMVIASVGLAQNFAALRALATDGIQKGHMRLHARQMAIAAGATPDEVEYVADTLRKDGEIRLERAIEIVKALRGS